MNDIAMNSIDFTLLASSKLTELTRDSELQKAVRQGNQDVINEIFQEILENLTKIFTTSLNMPSQKTI